MTGINHSAHRARWSAASRCPETGKVRHVSKAEAKQWASQRHAGERKQAYKCEHCGFWHLGRPHPLGTRNPQARCGVDPSAVYVTWEDAAASAKRIGASAFPAPCGDHWHVTHLESA